MSGEVVLLQIQSVLRDDENYQTPDLKIGAIWALCDSYAEYRRGIDVQGGILVEIIPRQS